MARTALGVEQRGAQFDGIERSVLDGLGALASEVIGFAGFDVRVVLGESVVELAVCVEVRRLTRVANGLGELFDRLARQDGARGNLVGVAVGEAGDERIGDMISIDNKERGHGHGRHVPGAAEAYAAMTRGAGLVHETSATGANEDALLGTLEARCARCTLGMIAKAQAGQVGHMPKLRAHALAHRDAVAVVVCTGARIQIGELCEAGEHGAVGLETAAAHADAALCADANLGAVLLDDDAHNGAVFALDKFLAGGAVPYGEVVTCALLDVLDKRVEVGHIELSGIEQDVQACLVALELRELVPHGNPTAAAHVPSVILPDPSGVVGRADAVLVLRAGLLGVDAQNVDGPVPVLCGLVGVSAQALGIVVAVVAHETGEVGIERVGIIGGKDVLASETGVAAYRAFRGLFTQENLRPLFVGCNGGVHAGSAHAEHDDVVLLIKCLLVCKGGSGETGGSQCGCSEGSAFNEMPAGDVGHGVPLSSGARMSYAMRAFRGMDGCSPNGCRPLICDASVRLSAAPLTFSRLHPGAAGKGHKVRDFGNCEAGEGIHRIWDCVV